jgi:hypothetical protein
MDLQLSTVSDPKGTTGSFLAGTQRFYTVELPWANNAPDESCVPAGVYELVPYTSPIHGRTFCLLNSDLKIMGCDSLSPAEVSRGYRSFCELHSANFPRQLLGCIGIGMQGMPMLDPVTGEVSDAVEDSRNAVTELMAMLGASSGHTLTISRTFA